MTTDNTTIDFAEDGRLLAAATPGPWQSDFGGFHVSSVPLDYDDVASFNAAPDGEVSVAPRNHAAAYREVVVAASEYRLMVWAKHGDSCECNESAERLDDALARFRNITETP